MRFRDKCVVITGASRGIGAAIAQRFASEGASVLLAANEPRVSDAAAEIARAGGKAASFIVDVTSRTEVAAMYDEAERRFGKVDISIQNAGVITIASAPCLAHIAFTSGFCTTLVISAFSFSTIAGGVLAGTNSPTQKS